jgi:hypothetical protein
MERMIRHTRTFLSEVYENYLTANPVAQDYVSTFEKLNEIGFFTRILLEEYRRMGVRLYGTQEETQFRKESLDFLQFLKNLAFRNPGDNTTLAFNGERIKIGLVLVAKKGTYIHKGIDAYIRRIEKNITLGIQRMFILSYAQRYDETAVDALRRQLALPPPGLRPNFALVMALADAVPEVM